MRKGKDPEPYPDPYLLLIDPDPGGPKTCGYGLVPNPDPQHCKTEMQKLQVGINTVLSRAHVLMFRIPCRNVKRSSS
jgi:hypothetical protein